MKFRTYLNLEESRQQLKATETGEFPDKLLAFLSVASVYPDPNEPWINTVFSFTKILNESQPDRKLPFVKDAPNKEDKPSAWDYEGRSWFYWANLFSKAYGWTLEYIAELETNDALALAQEILTEEQLDKEFAYGLSEVAYPYNSSTKKSSYKPLPRPYWMKETTSDLKKHKFPKSMLPVGVIEDVSGMPLEYNPLRDYVQKKTETKKTEPPPSA